MPFENEIDLLISSARLHLEDKDRERILCILRDNPDWAYLRLNSKRYGMCSLLREHIRSNNWTEFVPADFVAFLDEEYAAQSIRNLRVYGQLEQILEKTTRLNIPVILLKGIYLARWIYKDIAFRPMMDIDILCKKENVSDLQGLMMELGYKQNTKPKRSRLHENIILKRSSHLFPFVREGSSWVELHHELSPFFSSPRNERHIWDTKVPLQDNEFSVFSLSLEYQLLYLSTHLYEHLIKRKFTLYWFCDLHEYLNEYSDTIEWAALQRKADRLGVTLQVGTIFSLLRNYWDTKINTPEFKEIVPGIDLKILILDEKAFDRRNILFKYAKKLKASSQIKKKSEKVFYIWKFILPDKKFIISRYDIKKTKLVHLFYIYHLYRESRNGLISLFYNFIYVFKK